MADTAEPRKDAAVVGWLLLIPAAVEKHILPRRHSLGQIRTREAARNHRNGQPCIAMRSGCREALRWNLSGSPLLETVPAEHRPALCGFEGDGGFLPALRAGGLGFHPLASAAAIAAIPAAVPGIAPGLAALAPFRFVLEAFVCVELLLAGSKHEFTTAVSALQNTIVVFHDAPRAVGSSTAQGDEGFTAARWQAAKQKRRIQAKVIVTRFPPGLDSAWFCKT